MIIYWCAAAVVLNDNVIDVSIVMCGFERRPCFESVRILYNIELPTVVIPTADILDSQIGTK